MSDQVTALPWAKLRRIKGKNYVVVDTKKIYGGVTPTIQGLATDLRLQPEVVLRSLLHFQSNAHVVRALYEDNRSPSDPENFPGLGRARIILKEAATVFTATGHGRYIETTTTPYKGWGVDVTKPVILPMSKGFETVLAEATERLKRDLRIAVVKPSYAPLRDKLADMRVSARLLVSNEKLVNGLLENDAKELAILEVLDGLLNAMLSPPPNSPNDRARQTIEELKTKLRTLRTEAANHLLMNPVDDFVADLVKERDQYTNQLVSQVEDAYFVALIRVIASNYDIVPHDLWQDVLDTLQQAYTALLVSPKAEYILTTHIEPLVNLLASTDFDVSSLRAPKHPTLEQAAKERPTAPNLDSHISAIVVLLGVAQVAGATVGNMPGPYSLSVAVLHVAAPMMLARIYRGFSEAARAGEALKLSGRMYRFLVNAADLNMDQRVNLLLAIDDGDMNSLRGVKWSSRFMNSPAWGAAMSIAGLLVFAAAVQSNDESTLRKWSNIIGSASATLGGLAVAFQRFSVLVERQIVMGIGAEVLGIIGGVAAAISGAVTAYKEYQTGDTTGMWIGIGLAAGGALAAAGSAVAFLVATGMMTSATVAGAPLGTVLLIAGAVITGVAVLVDVLRGIFSTGSQEVFESYLHHFGRNFGPYATAAAKRPTLKAAYGAADSAQGDATFWDVRTALIPQLSDLGFTVEAIAEITDEDEDDVQSTLRRENRIQ
jgi:hypothetical protein